MKYLKYYKLFESNILNDIKDVLDDLTDFGFIIKVDDMQNELMPHWKIDIGGKGNDSITINDFVDMCLRIKSMLEQTGDVCRISIIGSTFIEVYNGENGLKMSVNNRFIDMVNKTEMGNKSLNDFINNDSDEDDIYDLDRFGDEDDEDDYFDSKIEILLIKPNKLNELNKSTYINAAKKLSDIRHNDRAMELLKYSKGLINIKTRTDGVMNVYPIILNKAMIDMPIDFRKTNSGLVVPTYKTIFIIKGDKSREIMEIDEYEIVQKWIDANDTSDMFSIKYVFDFRIIDNIPNTDDGYANDCIELIIDLYIDNDGFSFLSSENSEFSFVDRNSAREFKNLLKMIVLKSETYVQRIIDNEYFSKIKWDDIVRVLNGISLNELYNKDGIINFDFGHSYYKY